MTKKLISRSLLAVGLSFLLLAAIPAFAQDESHGGAMDVRQHGYEHGFRDGYDYGRDVRARGAALDYRTDAYRSADHGYYPALGSPDVFRAGYRDGYRDGSEDGFNGDRTRLERLFAWRDRSFDPDRGGDDRMAAEYHQPGWTFQDVAADIGYRDGVSAGLKDFSDHHSFRPTDHGAWKDADHGYAKAFGDKSLYKAAYRTAYEAGYRNGFGVH